MVVVKPIAEYVVCALLIALCAPSLAQEPVNCRECGRKIFGDYIRVGESCYHPEHFVCARCGKTIVGSFYQYYGNNYDTACYETFVVPKCVICGEPIEDGTAYTKDYWGDVWHNRHLEVTCCDFCRRPIVGGYAAGRKRHPDGRELCGVCGAVAVTTEERARALMIAAAAGLRENGVVVDTDEISLLLLPRSTLDRLSTDGRGLTGYSDCAAMGSSPADRQFARNIMVLDGMPQAQMTATLAHELMHIWFCVNGCFHLEKSLEEGSCQYAAALVLRKIGGAESDFIIHTLATDEDPVYGGGFRMVSRCVDKHGVARWLEEIEKDAPDVARLGE
ncbi:MAG: hypothetical protein H6Q78_815 [Candidatus Krumholzibacteriota bacterium]|nr:hypothetical protein [Candidatus Krumholzibacteriota bacterium]